MASCGICTLIITATHANTCYCYSYLINMDLLLNFI